MKRSLTTLALLLMVSATAAPASGSAAAPARQAASQRPATLAQTSCQRLPETLVSFHQTHAVYQRLAIGRGMPGNPEIARLQPRVDRVEAWLAAHGYQPRESSQGEVALRNATTEEKLIEFERRCES